MARKYVWRGHASSDGPILVADSSVYAHWCGAQETWSENATFRVHYYGPLVARLPPKLQPRGGDASRQYALCAGAAATRAFLRTLREEALRLEPALSVREQRAMSNERLLARARGALTSESSLDDWLSAWRDHSELGSDFELGAERLLHVDAGPDTDYERACAALAGDIGFVEIGGVRALVFGFADPGTARIGYEAEGFLLLRTWTREGDDGDGKDESAAERAAREHAENATAEERDAGTIRFSTGKIAVVWAAVAAADVVERKTDVPELTGVLQLAVEASAAVRLDESGAIGIGSLVSLAPGEYAVRHGEHTGESYRCRWLRISAR